MKAENRTMAYEDAPAVETVTDPDQLERYFQPDETGWIRRFSPKEVFGSAVSFPEAVLSQYTEQGFYSALAEAWEGGGEYQRAAAAAVGGPRQWEGLVKDESALVRGTVARYATDMYRILLLEDPDPVVRRQLARFGGDALLEGLMEKERDPYVLRTACARSTSQPAIDGLAESHWGSAEALIVCAPYMSDTALLRLAKHPADSVKGAAAQYGGADVCRAVLAASPDSFTRYLAGERLRDIPAEAGPEAPQAAEGFDSVAACLESAVRTEEKVLSGPREWGRFLQTAGRLYKYPYRDALLLYAQRPEATACAEAEVWGGRMGREVTDESRGISLVAGSGEGAYLRTVYDLADTQGRKFPQPWQYGPRYEEAVKKAFGQAYHVKGEALEELVTGAVRHLMGQKLPKDAANREFIEKSACYMVLSRCGQEPVDACQPPEGARPQQRQAARAALGIGAIVLRQMEGAIRQAILENRKRRPKPQTPGQISFFAPAPQPVAAQAPAVKGVAASRPETTKAPAQPGGSQAVIDEALRIGANDPSSRLRIIAEFMKGKPLEENARFLQNHYKENGAGFYVEERKYALWYDNACMMISPGESVQPQNVSYITWEQAAGRVRELLDAGQYADRDTLSRAWEFERGRVAEALIHMQGDIADDARDKYFPTLRRAFEGVFGHPDRLKKVKELMQEPESLQGLVDECGAFMADYAHDRDLLRFHYHKTDEILQGLKDLQSEPLKFTAAEDFTPQRRLFISQDEIDKLLREGPDQHDYRIGVYKFFETHPDKKEREKYLQDLHGAYSGFYGGNDSITYTSKGVGFSHGSITEPYAKVELKWNKVRSRIEELIAKGTFLSDEDREILEGRYLGADTEQAVEIPPETAQRKTPYQVVVYHHIENGFDEKLDYQTLAEAEKAAQGYIDGSMEEDGFEYEGAGVYDLVEEKWLRVFGDFPHERAQEEVRLASPVESIDAPGQMELGAADAQEPIEDEAGFIADYPDETPPWGVEEGEHSPWGAVQASRELAAGTYKISTASHGGILVRESDAAGLLSPETLARGGHDCGWYYFEEDELAPIVVKEMEKKGLYHTPPYIFCEWSESPVFQDKTAYPLFEFDRLMKGADSSHAAKQAEGIQKYGSWQALYDADDPEYAPFLGYDKVKFTLHMPDGRTYTERQDIGDGDGGVVDFLSQYEKYKDIMPVLREKIGKERATQETVPPAVEPPKPTSTIEAIYPADKNNLPFEIIVEKLHIPEQEKPAHAPNFRITDENLGVGGAKAHYKMNVDAIKLLRQLQAEDRQATPDEQDILSKYVGWGGLSDAFDETKPAWASEYKELQELLSPEEYASARASTLNSHYTLPTVIRAMYQALENMGFHGGNILEPSMGVGNFFGCLPDSMRNSKLYGVELDSITGQIAKQLYPQADITVAGFETTDRHNFYDAAIGNVPFGNYQVHDPAYNRLGFSIHNYFFAKALDQVRPGGIVAFLTSHYTLDSRDTKVRKYLAERADLLGAIRLPNNTFRANAGTEVIEDILFLQKREAPVEETPSWVQTGETPLGFRINQYFLDNPHMVLGEEKAVSSQYKAQEYSVEAFADADLGQQLAAAITHIHGEYMEAEPPELVQENGEPAGDVLPADPDVKNFSFTVRDGDVYYREDSIMVKQKMIKKEEERVKGMIALRDCVQKLIGQQMDGFISDEAIRETQAELNALYDDFQINFGYINTKANERAFEEDSSYYLLCGLEEMDTEGKPAGKADIFTKRTVRPHMEITHVDTAAEALAVSIGEHGKVDMPYMERLTGKTEEEIYRELQGVIFLNPMYGYGGGEKKYLPADEYLSGNVREKLAWAKQRAQLYPEDYALHVQALEKAQPKDLDASEIDARLGAAWISPEYYKQFMVETFGLTPAQARYAKVLYSPATGEWKVEAHGVYTAQMDHFSTGRKEAAELLEASLNQRAVQVADYHIDRYTGKRKGVVNQKETTLAREKQQALQGVFKEWLWQDPQRRADLCKLYNEKFNSTRPREYDGSHLVLEGIDPSIRLREHQKNAIAHALYGGNTLFAHCVGAGKTFEIAASAMESKRLGLCSKSLIVVPNHLVGQWGREFQRLYPAANILVSRESDFTPKNRRKFCARIATGGYDAVIIGHSQLGFIPLSRERQEKWLHQEMEATAHAIKEAKEAHGGRFTVKQLERTRKALSVKLEKLQNSARHDDVVTFEELGVDKLFVDEAHEFKNCPFVTKMGNVAGLSPEGSIKANELLMKCQYLDELTGGRGVVFATGTPVSNSIAEMYTMMRYLQRDRLEENNWHFFDNWAAQFAETVTQQELAPEGTGYRERTRLAKFSNLPELMSVFKEAADVKTAEDLDLPTPEAVFHVEQAQPSQEQKRLVQDLSRRAEAVHDKKVDPREDNLLKITTDGRKLGLDQRLADPALPDDPGSKLNLCVENVYNIWRDGAAEKQTQLIFCDTSTPKGAMGAPQAFNVYEDIFDKLTARGVPREQIAFIHDYPTREKKNALFAKVRAGEVRVLLGSTQKMGTGMNVQDRLIAVHDLDCPWRPSDLEQRLGRAVRQGNQNKEVHIYRYVTDGTFDAVLWQTVEKKQQFISQVMTSKNPVRSYTDVDETALSYAEIKALCAGDPRIKERMELDVDVAKLKLLEGEYKSRQYALQTRVAIDYPKYAAARKQNIQALEKDIAGRDAAPLPKEGFVGMEILGRQYQEKEAAGAALLEACKGMHLTEKREIGLYRGFRLTAERAEFGFATRLYLHGSAAHELELGESAIGTITRLDNCLGRLEKDLEFQQRKLEELHRDEAADRAELGKPFERAGELREKEQRLAELTAQLELGAGAPAAQDVPGFARRFYDLAQACAIGDHPEGPDGSAFVGKIADSLRQGDFREVRETLERVERGPFSLTRKEQAHRLLEDLQGIEASREPQPEPARKIPVRDSGPER